MEPHEKSRNLDNVQRRPDSIDLYSTQKRQAQDEIYQYLFFSSRGGKKQLKKHKHNNLKFYVFPTNLCMQLCFFFSIANGKNLHLVFTTELYLQLCFLYENNELE